METVRAGYTRLLRSVLPTEPEVPPGVVWKKKDPRKDFKFGPELGHGNYGAVHSVTDMQSGKVAACKVIRKDGSSYQRTHITTEVAALHRVGSHTNVATLYEVYETPTYFYIFMEPCLGGELFDVILTRGHFSERDAAVVMHVILDVIRYCHERGIAHRDFKPENFLLRRKALNPMTPLRGEDLRAVDFGLATFLKPGGRLKELLGSPFYVAPELLRGDYGYPVDVWSAGVILYILLSGMPPFGGTNECEVFRRILRQKLDLTSEPWPSISENAKDLVSRLLERDPAKRLTPDEALQHKWLKSAVSDNLLHSNLVMERLEEFRRMTKLQGLLMNVIAKNLSTESIVSLKDAFNALDTDGDGYLSFEELRQGLDAASGNSAQGSEAAKAVMEALDVSGDGSIEYHEFLAAVVDRQRTLTDQTLAEMFAYLDKNGDGMISPQELYDTLKECDISISKDTLLQLMAQELPSDHVKNGAHLTSELFVALLRGSLKSESIRFLQLEHALSDMRKSFRMKNRFRQLALLVIARTTPSAELVGLKQLFERLDKDKSGCLSLIELAQGLKAIDPELSEEDIDELLDFMDVDGNRQIDYHEFVVGILEDKQLLTEAKLHTAFNYFDTDRNGLIEVAEVEAVVRDLNIKLSQSPVELLALADSNHDQVVDFSEFREMMLAEPPNIFTNRQQSLQLRHSDTSSCSATSNFSATTSQALEDLQKPLTLRSDLQAPGLAVRCTSLSRAALAEAVSRDLTKSGTGLEGAIAEVRRENSFLLSPSFAGTSSDLRKALRAGSAITNPSLVLPSNGQVSDMVPSSHEGGPRPSSGDSAKTATARDSSQEPLMKSPYGRANDGVVESPWGQSQPFEADGNGEQPVEDMQLSSVRQQRANKLGPPRASMPVVSQTTRKRPAESHRHRTSEDQVALAGSSPSGSLPPFQKIGSGQVRERNVSWLDEAGESLTTDQPRRRRPQHIFMSGIGSHSLTRWETLHLDDNALLAKLTEAPMDPARSLGSSSRFRESEEDLDARARASEHTQANGHHWAAQPSSRRSQEQMVAALATRIYDSPQSPGSPELSSSSSGRGPQITGGSVSAERNLGRSAKPMPQRQASGVARRVPPSVWAEAPDVLGRDSESAEAAELRMVRALTLSRHNTEPLRDMISMMEVWWSERSLLEKERRST